MRDFQTAPNKAGVLDQKKPQKQNTFICQIVIRCYITSEREGKTRFFMFLLIITVTLSLYLNGVIQSQICIYAYWALKVPIKEERTESCLLQTHFAI